MGALGGLEWMVIILVVLLLFGAKKIPELAKGMGQGINEFRKASAEIRSEIDKGTKEEAQAKKTEPKTEKKEPEPEKTEPKTETENNSASDANKEK
ncbi:MAG: twin-arginine translocase TatA/TatE family subunit [Balneolales bacterium]